MSENKKKSKPEQPHWYRAANSIPFVALFKNGDRRARRALEDPTIPPELRAELERYLANTPHAAAVDQQKLLRQAALAFDAAESRAAPLRRGGATGRKNKRTEAVRQHIRTLLAEHPKLAKNLPQLWKRRDQILVGNMAEKTFTNHVRAVLKE